MVYSGMIAKTQNRPAKSKESTNQACNSTVHRAHVHNQINGIYKMHIPSK